MKKIHRFFIHKNFTLGAETLTDKTIVHQCARVLKLVPGEHIILFNEIGVEALVLIEKCTPKELLVVVQEINKKTESGRTVTAYIAILKGEHFEQAVAKAVEVGVSVIVPLVTTRTVKTGLKKDRLHKIIQESAEQSGRTIIPTLNEPKTFIEALASVKDASNTILFDPSGDPYHVILPQIGSKVSIFIGPEGGWSEDEISNVREKNILIASLGQHILRGETASIIGTFLAVNTK